MMTNRFSTAAIAANLAKGLVAAVVVLGPLADVASAARPAGGDNAVQAVKQGRRHGHHRPDLAAAAAELNTTEAELREALGVPDREQMRERGQERFAAAASQLDVTAAQLRDALGITLDAEGRPERPRTRPDLAAAAAELGVTEAELRTAFGAGEGRRERPQLDIAGAAQQFDVTEAELRNILGLRERGDRR